MSKDRYGHQGVRELVEQKERVKKGYSNNDYNGSN